MFGFFKKKSATNAETATAKDVEPIASMNERDLEKSAAINEEQPKFELTLDDVRLLAELNWKSNEGASMHFAQCGGFPDEYILSGKFGKFYNIIFHSDLEKFTEQDKIKASQMFFVSSFRKISKGFCSENTRIAELCIVIKSGFLKPSALQGIEIKEVAELLFEIAKQKRDKDWTMLANSADAKFEYLAPIFRRLQNASIDKYGEYDSTAILQEVDDFIETMFNKDDFDFYYTVKPAVELLHHIETRLEILNSSGSINMPEDGIEFEYWCANELTKQGWVTQVSKASGDQGIDIIAKRDGLSVAVQCKRYGQPIGNKAVQEIFTAKQFVGAKHACVIGTGGFTKSAKELAGATEVFLVEAEGGLQNFSERFGFSPIEGNELKSIGTTNPNDDDEVCIESLRDLLGVEMHFETAEQYLIPQLAKSYLLQVMAMSSDLDTERNNSVIEAISSPRPCTIKLLEPEWKFVLQTFLSSMMSEISSETKASILGGSGEFSDAVVDAVAAYDECPPVYVALDISQIRDVMLKFSEVLDQIDEPDFEDDDLEVWRFFQEMVGN